MEECKPPANSYKKQGYPKPYLLSEKAVFEVAVGLSKDAQGFNTIDIEQIC